MDEIDLNSVRTREDLLPIIEQMVHQLHTSVEELKTEIQKNRKGLFPKIQALVAMNESSLMLSLILLHFSLVLPSSNEPVSAETLQKVRQEIYGDFSQLLFEFRKLGAKRTSKDYDPSVR